MVVAKTKQIDKSAAVKVSTLWRSLRTILLTIGLLVVINIFFLGNFEVTGPSMESKLLNGDRVLVSKLHYGARLPRVLKVPFIDHHLPLLDYLGMRLYSQPLLPYFRTFAFSKLERGDIVVFNAPTTENEYEVNSAINKRIVGLPGDNIMLNNGVLHVNGKKEKNTDISFLYDLVVEKKLNAQSSKQWGIFDFQNQIKLVDNPFTKDSIEYELYGNEAIIAKAKNDPNVIKIVKKRRDNFADFNTYPHWLPFHWNKDNFGSLRIPKKGMTLTMDSANLHRYFHVIKDLDGNKQAEIRDGKLVINNMHVMHYQFKKDYFFALGDNRDISLDSRHWGFVPEDHIIGKVILIYFSKDFYLNEFRWNRFFQLPE